MMENIEIKIIDVARDATDLASNALATSKYIDASADTLQVYEIDILLEDAKMIVSNLKRAKQYVEKDIK